MRRSIAFAILLISATITADARGALRVALIVTGSDKTLSSLVTLAEAKLSEHQQIELLDRNSIRTVLEEQKLSLSGLVSADQAVAAGKLLRVEVFAFLQTLGEETSPVLTVFDAFNGARLIDVELPKDTVTAQVDAIALGIQRARSKLSAPLHAKTLCLLSVRNADLPRSQDGLCNAAAVLLERRLLASDDVRLLERKRLEGINKERQLGTLDAKHDILASVVAIDLEFSRAKEGNDEVTMTASLSDSSSKPLTDAQTNPLPALSTKIDKDKIAGSIDQLAIQIANAISVAPGQAALDPLKEGRRFISEAQFLLAHAQIREGLQAADSAYALSPDYRGCAKLLGSALLSRSNEMLRHGEGDQAALELATRAFEVRDMRLVSLRNAHATSRELSLEPDSVTGDRAIDLLEHALKPPASHDPGIRTAARQLSDAYLRFARDWLATSEAASAGDERMLAHHIEYVRLNRIVIAMGAATSSMSEYIDDACGVYERFFHLVDALKPDAALRLYVYAGRLIGENTLLWNVRAHGWTASSFKGGDADRIAHLFQLLADHPSAAVRFYGLWNRLRFDSAAGRISGEDFQAQYEVAAKAARAAMDDRALIAIDRNGFLRNQLYWNAMSIQGRDQQPNRRLEDRLGWYDFIIQRREVPQLAIYYLPDLRLMKADSQQLVSVLQRISSLVEDPTCSFIGCSRAEAQAQLANKIGVISAADSIVKQAFAGGTDDTRKLLEIGEGITSIDQVVARVHEVYAIVSASEDGGNEVRALRVALDGSGARSIGSIAGAAEVNDVCLTDQYVIAATDHGIYLFPRAGGKASKITSNDGLPTDIAQSVTMLGDVIYAGLGDRGYLVSYDLNARKCNVLASSRRKTKASPFDDAGGFKIVRIVADAAKHRLLLVHCHPGRFEANGLWQLDPDTGKFAQLLKVFFDYGDRNASASRILADGRMVIQSYNWALTFDTQKDATQVLFEDMIGVGPDHHKRDLPFEFNKQLAAPYTVVGSNLWAGFPLSRVEPQTNHVDVITLPAPDTGGRDRPATRRSRPAAQPSTQAFRKVNNVGQNECTLLEPMPDGEHVIAGNARILWLVPAMTAGRPTTRAAH